MQSLDEVSLPIFIARIVLNFVVVASLIIFAIILLIKMRDKEKETGQYYIYMGYTIFLITYAITRVCFTVTDFIVYNGGKGTLLDSMFAALAYSFSVGGFIILFFNFERYILHTKFVFTVLGLGVFSFSVLAAALIIPRELARTLNSIALPIFFIIIVSLYLYVGSKGKGEIRKKAFGIAIGMIIVAFALLWDSDVFGGVLALIGLNYIIRILVSPFIIIIGLAIFTFTNT